MQPVQRDLLGECPCELTPISMVYTPQHIHDSKSVHSTVYIKHMCTLVILLHISMYPVIRYTPHTHRHTSLWLSAQIQKSPLRAFLFHAPHEP